MDEKTTYTFGGNKLALWYGKVLKNASESIMKRANNLILKGNKIVITNPASKLINPFTLLITFVVDKGKYQLILEGDYKDKYKNQKEDEPLIPNEELFMMIRSRKKQWFLKV